MPKENETCPERIMKEEAPTYIPVTCIELCLDDVYGNLNATFHLISYEYVKQEDGETFIRFNSSHLTILRPNEVTNLLPDEHTFSYDDYLNFGYYARRNQYYETIMNDWRNHLLSFDENNPQGICALNEKYLLWSDDSKSSLCGYFTFKDVISDIKSKQKYIRVHPFSEEEDVAEILNKLKNFIVCMSTA